MTALHAALIAVAGAVALGVAPAQAQSGRASGEAHGDAAARGGLVQELDAWLRHHGPWGWSDGWRRYDARRCEAYYRRHGWDGRWDSRRIADRVRRDRTWYECEHDRLHDRLERMHTDWHRRHGWYPTKGSWQRRHDELHRRLDRLHAQWHRDNRYDARYGRGYDPRGDRGRARGRGRD
jgi:hypothetical protein